VCRLSGIFLPILGPESRFFFFFLPVPSRRAVTAGYCEPFARKGRVSAQRLSSCGAEGERSGERFFFPFPFLEKIAGGRMGSGEQTSPVLLG